MSSAAVWLLVAVSVALLPGRGRAPARERHREQPAEARRRGSIASGKGLVVTAVAAVIGCVVLLGPLRGVTVAVVVGPAVLGVTRLLERRAGAPPLDRSVALALDLTAAALRGGKPLGDALSAAASAAAPAARAELLRVAGLLRLGADTEQAWSRVRDGPLAAVAVVAVRSAASGMRLAAALERTAGDIRAERAAAAAARAHRAGVSAMAPLAACFLPSFVCLGIVPVIVGIARTALGVLP